MDALKIAEQETRLQRLEEFKRTIPAKNITYKFWSKEKKAARRQQLKKRGVLSQLHAEGNNQAFWSVINSTLEIIGDADIPFAEAAAQAAE